MSTERPQLDAAQAVLARDSPVVVLRGPAGAGKTRAALDIYEHYAAADGALLLAPNRLTVEQMRRELLARGESGVLAGANVLTFGGLAGRILSAGGAAGRPISATHRRVLLENLIADLARAGELSAMASVADTPGLVGAIDRGIAELKRSAVAPDALAATVGKARGKHQDLLSVYRAYQDYLNSNDLYDTEGLMWLARLTLADCGPGAAGNPGAVIVDGFTDFTPTQLDILALLGGHAAKTLITLPHADQPRRARLWHWTDRQLNRIRRTFGQRCAVIDSPTPPRGPLAGLADKLFDIEPPETDWPEALTLISAAGIESECRAIARWTKRHLRDGAPADDLLIVARSIDDYRPTLARVFAEAELPTPPVLTPLSGTAVGRFVRAVVRLADGFAHADALAVIASSYFRPDVLGEFDGQVPGVAELIVRQGNVLDGRQNYAHAAARLAERARRQAEQLADDDDDLSGPFDRHLAQLGAEAIERAGQMLDALFAIVAPIVGAKSLAEKALATLSVLDSLRLARAAAASGEEAAIAADLRALAGIRAMLEQLMNLPGPLGSRELSADRFVQTVSTLLGETPSPAARAGGAPAVVGAIDARATRARHVWLAGLNDGEFPRVAAEQALIGEADRRRWVAHGLAIDARDDLVAREMLLFYLTAARADATLTVSWLYSNSEGRQLQPSGFLVALVRPTGQWVSRVHSLPPAEHAPPPERIACRRELLNAALAGAAARPDEPCRDGWLAALGAARERHGERLARLGSLIWVDSRRWLRGQCDRFDGVLDDRDLLAEMAVRVPSEVVFSATQISRYLECPWRYFAEYWLRLAPLEDPAETLVPRTRGLLAHAVMRRLTEELSRSGQPATSDLSAPAAEEAMDRVIEVERQRAEAFGVPYPALWRAELRQLRRAIKLYLDRQAGSTVPPGRIAHQELPFGQGEPDPSLPPGRERPLEIPGPDGPIRLRGKIDRVDILDWPEGSRSAFVIDYKTGGVPDPRKDVQLPIYLAAAEQLLGMPAAGGAFHTLRLGKAEDKTIAAFSDIPRDWPGYEELREEILDSLRDAVSRIRAGAFPVFPTHDCSRVSCPMRRVCGFSRTRGVFKGRPEEEDDE